MRIRAARLETSDGRAAEIRSARPGEAGALLDHLARVHAREPRANPAPDYTVDALRALIGELSEAAGGALLVAAHGDAVVGSLAVRPVAGAGAEIGISIHPGWRRRGLATGLLRTAVDALSPVVKRLVLEVAPDNGPACALFESFGFREESESDDKLRRMALDLR